MDGLLVGRFQPFHLGHLHALRFALSQVDRLWLGLGSSNRPIGRNDPFSAPERKEMILSSVGGPIRERISIYPIPDLDDHARWVEMIDGIVPKFQTVFSNDPMTARLYSKRPVRVVPIPFLNRGDLSGTNVRNLLVAAPPSAATASADHGWERLVPEGTRDFLIRSGARERLKDL